MSRIAYIIVGSLAALLGLGAFAYFNRGKDEEQQEEESTFGISEVGVPQVEQAETENEGEATEPLDTDSGKGATLINARMRQLDQSSAKSEIKGSNALYQGVGEWKTELMTVMAKIFGAATSLPIYAYNLQPQWKNFLDTIKNTEDLNPMSQGGRIELAIENWKNVLTFGPTGISFWPANLPQLIEDGYFKASGSADKDRSERYDAFTSAMKVVAGNLQKASKNYTTNLRNRAIADLVSAGYKFYGINA